MSIVGSHSAAYFVTGKSYCYLITTQYKHTTIYDIL